MSDVCCYKSVRYQCDCAHLLTIGNDCVSWLGDIQNLLTSAEFEDNPYGENDTVTPFPVRPIDRRSYTQNCVVWIKQSGLQADIQKILRNAKKIPDKQVHFFKVCFLDRMDMYCYDNSFYTSISCASFDYYLG